MMNQASHNSAGIYATVQNAITAANMSLKYELYDMFF